MKLLNKVFISTVIITAAINTAIACPPTVTFGSTGVGEEIDAIIYDGVGYRAIYRTDGNTKGIVWVSTPAGSWFFPCDDRPADCAPILADIIDGNVPTNPDEVDTTPDETEPVDGGTTTAAPVYSSPGFRGYGDPALADKYFDRSKMITISDCKVITEITNKIQWSLIKKQYTQKNKYGKYYK